jgi:hypothetical protein
MMKKAKTYYSNNGWTAPQGLSTFGIPIPCKKNKLTLGLEEFNGIKLLRKNKLAFVPAFSIERNFLVDELKLFYSVPGRTFHYGTMRGVQQIDHRSVPDLRNNQLAELPAIVESAFLQAHEYAECSRQAYAIWNKYYNANNILATGHNLRFVVNVKYESLELFDGHTAVRWQNLTRAKSLYD